jgi:uncharacterized integral membrane protein
VKKIIFWLLWLPIGAIIVILAVANRTPVTLKMDPRTLQSGQITPFPSYDLPLFLIMFGFLILGVILGGMVVWAKQGKWRRKAREAEKENQVITRDMQRVKLERAALTPPSVI